jgi:predicted nuclease of predicted toxin-antitoxin system
MKVLIDENLSERLHADFLRHKAYTVSYMGWKGKENGELIRMMIECQFEALITLDKNLQYQQNFKQYPMVVVVIHAAKTEYKFLQPLVPKINTLLDTTPAKGVYIIEQT